MKKALVKIEKNTKKISYTGLTYLYPLLKNKGEIFEAFVDEKKDRIYIDITKYEGKLYNYVDLITLNYLMLHHNIEGEKAERTYWVSALKSTKEKISRCYTFNIIEDKQLELEF